MLTSCSGGSAPDAKAHEGAGSSLVPRPRAQAHSLGSIPLHCDTFGEDSTAPACPSLLLLLCPAEQSPSWGCSPHPREPSSHTACGAGHQGWGFGAGGLPHSSPQQPFPPVVSAAGTRSWWGSHHLPPTTPVPCPPPAMPPAQPRCAHTLRSRYPSVPAAIAPEPGGPRATPSPSPALPMHDAPVSVPHQHCPFR